MRNTRKVTITGPLGDVIKFVKRLDTEANPGVELIIPVPETFENYEVLKTEVESVKVDLGKGLKVIDTTEKRVEENESIAKDVASTYVTSDIPLLDYMIKLFQPCIKSYGDICSFVNTVYQLISAPWYDKQELTQDYVVGTLEPKYRENRFGRSPSIDCEFAVGTFYNNTFIDAELIRDLMVRVINGWDKTYTGPTNFFNSIFGRELL